jgi:lipoprotein signal peptidase
MRQMRRKKREISLFLFFGFLAVDQASKYFSLKHAYGFLNRGASFGILTPGLIVPVSFTIALFFIISFLRSRQRSFFFIAAGGTSNLIDRLARGGVVDFISLPGLPLFNPADLAICLGGAIFFIDLAKKKKVR